MRLALLSRDEAGRDPSAWALLPGLCCQAAGGNPQWADPVAAAWLLFYTAAHLMDSLEDQDAPDPWWEKQGPAAALNAATGLYFSASLALQELSSLPLQPEVPNAVARQVLRPFLQMSSGQYAEFLHPPQSLEAYWRIAAAKSGAFFALACRAGARLATDDEDRLAGFDQFGLNIGLMVQVLDDLGDYKDLSRPDRAVDPNSLARSLPAIYIREVCPEAAERFEQVLRETGSGPSALQDLAAILEQNGGVLYLLMELDLRSSQALAGLEAAQALSPARDDLAALIAELNAPLSDHTTP